MSTCEYGRITLTIDGERLSARGAFEIKPNNFEREAGLNLDSTLWSTVKPMPAEASGSIDVCSAEDFAKMLNACKLTAVFELGNPENPTTYIYPEALLVGRPSLNTETGEVTDFVINSAIARKI
ncbi:MAG: phage tail tube protein [Arenicella sp.]